MANKLTVSYGSATLINQLEVEGNVAITYNGATIATVGEGTKTLKCAGKVMKSDLVMGGKTLKCAGKKMATDIGVLVEAASVQLAAPVITLSNKIVSWAAIPNASNYALVVDTSSPITVTTTSFDLSTLTLTEGDHTVKVMAKGDGVRYLDSELSNTVTYTVEPQGETWVINESPSIDTDDIDEDIRFVSNELNFNSIYISVVPRGCDITYIYGPSFSEMIKVCSATPFGLEWINQAYRTIYFPIPPTGDLRTWLQTNAVKQ